MFDFETARMIAGAHERPMYPDGTFMTAPYGWEDAAHYNVVAGPREWLVDEDPDYFPPSNDRCLLVRKDTGAVEVVNPADDVMRDKLDKMKPVGTGHPEDED